VRSLVAKVGELEFELIQPLEGESPQKEFLDRKGEGIHHLAYDVENLEEEVTKLTKQGFNVLRNGNWQGGGFACLEAGVGDLIFELMQR
jgi:4-hydroxyphenylpyruvate dioxygenase-like putative hemolysin